MSKTSTSTRDQLYGVEGKDYIDNCERFVFFSRAVLEAIRLLDLDVDVIHANDWQTGLVPRLPENSSTGTVRGISKLLRC